MTKACHIPEDAGLRDDVARLGGVIVIVDEDETRRTRRAGYLYRRGHDVVSIAAPSQFKQVLEGHKVDIIVLSELWSQDQAWIAHTLGAQNPFVLAAPSPFSGRGKRSGDDAPVERDDLESLDAVILAHRTTGPPRHYKGDIYEFQGWRLLQETLELISPDGQPVRLQRAAFNTLRALVSHPGRVLSRSQLLRLSQIDRGMNPRCVDFRIANLRRQLQCASDKACDLIKTVRGEGYVLEASVKHWSSL